MGVKGPKNQKRTSSYGHSRVSTRNESVSPVGRIVDWREARRLTFSFSVLDRRVKEAPWRAPRLQLRGSALNLIGSELISRLYEIVREYRLD